MVYGKEQNTHQVEKLGNFSSSGSSIDNLTIDGVEIVNQWQRRKTTRQRTNSREASVQGRKTKSDWPTRKSVKQEEAIGRKPTLVAQEIKAEQEPHYHDNEKQRKSDNVTDIHDS
jgi:hypothetical protein